MAASVLADMPRGDDGAHNEPIAQGAVPPVNLGPVPNIRLPADVSWIDSEVIDAPVLRAVKVHLQKGCMVFLKNSDISEVVSVKQCSDDHKPTSRLGTALSVAPYPSSQNGTEAQKIQLSRGAYLRRTDMRRKILPSFTQFYMGRVNVIVPEDRIEESAPHAQHPSASWIDFTSVLTMCVSMMRRIFVSGSVGVAMSAGVAVQRRWWLPLIVMSAKTWGLWGSDCADAPLETIANTAGAAKLYLGQTITAIKSTVSSAVMVLIIIFTTLFDWIIGNLLWDLAKLRGRSWQYSMSILSFRAPRVDSPSLVPILSPINTSEMVSPTTRMVPGVSLPPTTQDVDAATSGVGSENGCDMQALESETAPVCHAHLMYLSDQLHSSVAERKCGSTIAWVTPLLKSDFYMGKIEPAKDGLKRVPLCPVHFEKYASWAADQRCENPDCWEKGTEWESGNVTLFQCPGHAMERLAEPVQTTQTPARATRRNSAPLLSPVDEEIPAPKPKRRSSTSAGGQECVPNLDAWQKEAFGGSLPHSGLSSPQDSTSSMPGTITPSDDDEKWLPRDPDKEEFKKGLKSALKKATRKSHRVSTVPPEDTEPAPKTTTAKTTSFPPPYRVVSDEQTTDMRVVQNQQVPSERKQSANNAFLPSFLQKPKSRSTDFPVSIDFHPELKGPQTDPLGKMAELIANRYSENRPEKECDSASILEDAIFAMRGFGSFPVAVGIGAYGNALAQAIRRSSNDEKEIFLDAGVRCPVANRIAFATANLRFGAKRIGSEDRQSALLGDFLHSDRETIEDFVLNDTRPEPKPKQPATVHMFSKCATNQTNYFGLVYGTNHVKERMDAIRFLMRLREDTPRLFTVSFLTSVWEQLNADYTNKIVEGVRRLRQIGSITDTKHDLRRAALTVVGTGPGARPVWQYPKSFSMESSEGYWMRVVVPKMEDAVEKSGFQSALDKILGMESKTTKRPHRGNSNVETGQAEVGTIQEAAKRMYPAGKRNTSSGRSSAITNAPTDRQGSPICWDFARHSGCSRGAKCNNVHENITTPNLHWSVKCELARRGGLGNGKRIAPADVDGIVRQLCEGNQRKSGNQSEAGQNQSLPGNQIHSSDPMLADSPPGLGGAALPCVLGKPDTPSLNVQSEWPSQSVEDKQGIPDEFRTAQFTPMETVLRPVAHAGDDWVHTHDSCPKMQVPAEQLTDNQSRVAQWWTENAPSIEEILVPYVQNWLTVNGSEGTYMDQVAASLLFLQEKGSTRDSAAAKRPIQKMHGKEVGECIPSGCRAYFGESRKMIDYAVQDFRAGDLMFHLIDYGDQVRKSNQTRKLVGCGDDLENNQCAIIGLAAGVESIMQKVPHRPPNWSRVEEIARTIRESEVTVALLAFAAVSKPATQAELEVRSIAHNAVSMHHCRDLRTLRLFLMPALWQFGDIMVAVLEVEDSLATHAHVFSREGQISPSMIFLVAYKGHMRWAKATTYTPPTAWRDWEMSLDQITWDLSVSWEEFLESNRPAMETTQMIPCKQCKAKVKTILSECIVGTSMLTEPTCEPSVVEVGAGPRGQSASEDRSIPMGNTRLHEGAFPIRMKEWRLAEVDPLAREYLQSASVEFSMGNLQAVL